ncbi:MAG: hypothetical protein Terrestrivirus1_169 [Terrestrivirus sp.]|uniref:Uncharacterized protein n=1 Tax=Terrestrivirus sp. TaxID=2487775 RepID=A0A3G4ZKC9_9VIRU|nr:MAG: hypothetical protein Terrestrivirus1_169 [Terrestrivirus sp.]
MQTIYIDHSHSVIQCFTPRIILIMVVKCIMSTNISTSDPGHVDPNVIVVSLPILMPTPISPNKGSETDGILYYMSFQQNNYPSLANTPIKIMRSSIGGPAFRYQYNAFIGTVLVKEYNDPQLYSEIPNPNNYLPLCILYANFFRYAFMFNTQVVPATGAIPLSAKYANLINTCVTQANNNKNIQTVISDLVTLSKNVLSTADATSILNQEESQLELYINTFPSSTDQKTVTGMIQAYWIMIKTQTLNINYGQLENPQS